MCRILKCGICKVTDFRECECRGERIVDCSDELHICELCQGTDFEMRKTAKQIEVDYWMAKIAGSEEHKEIIELDKQQEMQIQPKVEMKKKRTRAQYSPEDDLELDHEDDKASKQTPVEQEPKKRPFKPKPKKKGTHMAFPFRPF